MLVSSASAARLCSNSIRFAVESIDYRVLLRRGANFCIFFRVFDCRPRGSSNLKTMLLRAPVTASAVSASWRQQDGYRNRVAENCRVGLAMDRRKNRGSKCSTTAIRAMGGESINSALTGVIFEPFTEVQNELALVSKSYSQSLARQRFSASCEAALNEQINVEYNVSYVYHALFAYFDRDNVGLPGFAKYFNDASAEERLHAEQLMKYQNMRGGRVKLQSILMPVMEFDNAEKGDALYAMELALSLEKLTNEKLLNLHAVAQESNDVQMTDYLEGTFLSEQVTAIKRVAEYVAQLRRVGKGHGVWHFDQTLQALHGAPVNGVAAGGPAAA